MIAVAMDVVIIPTQLIGDLSVQAQETITLPLFDRFFKDLHKTPIILHTQTPARLITIYFIVIPVAMLWIMMVSTVHLNCRNRTRTQL